MTLAVTDATSYLGAHMMLHLAAAGEPSLALTEAPAPAVYPPPVHPPAFAPAGTPSPLTIPSPSMTPGPVTPSSAVTTPALATPAGAANCIAVNRANIPDYAALLREHDVQTIIHFPAGGSVRRSLAHPERYYENNPIGTLQLLKACRAAGCVKHIVFSSTAAVYGVPGRMPISENMALAPISPYGASMAMAERMVRDITAAHGLSCVILRYFNAAGADPEERAGDTGESRHLITKISRLVAKHLTGGGALPVIQIYGNDYDTPDGTCVRDYIHVSDIAAAHYAAAIHLNEGGKSLTLNCGYGFGISVADVLDSVSRVAGIDIPTRISDRRAGDPPALIADNAAIRSELDWRPRFEELDFIIRTAINWEKKVLCS